MPSRCSCGVEQTEARLELSFAHRQGRRPIRRRNVRFVLPRRSGRARRRCARTCAFDRAGMISASGQRVAAEARPRALSAPLNTRPPSSMSARQRAGPTSATSGSIPRGAIGKPSLADRRAEARVAPAMRMSQQPRSRARRPCRHPRSAPSRAAARSEHRVQRRADDLVLVERAGSARRSGTARTRRCRRRRRTCRPRRARRCTAPRHRAQASPKMRAARATSQRSIAFSLPGYRA